MQKFLCGAVCDMERLHTGFILLCRMSNHEMSRKHKENAAYLKSVMQEDEADDSESEGEVEGKKDQAEPIKLSASDSISSLDEADLVNDSRQQIPVTANGPDGHSDGDGEGEGGEPLDDGTKNMDKGDEEIDFGAFGRRGKVVCGSIEVNELDNELVSL